MDTVDKSKSISQLIQLWPWVLVEFGTSMSLNKTLMDLLSGVSSVFANRCVFVDSHLTSLSACLAIELSAPLRHLRQTTGFIL